MYPIMQPNLERALFPYRKTTGKSPVPTVSRSTVKAHSTGPAKCEDSKSMRTLEAMAKSSIIPPGLRLAADAMARAAPHAPPCPSRSSPTLDTRVLALEVEREDHQLDRSLGVEMRRAFVLRVAPGFDFDNNKVEGWVEDVDTGRELRFRSAPDLLAFLSKCVKESAKKRNEDQEGQPS